MVDIVSGSHHHLKGRDQLTAGCTVPRHPKKPAEGEKVETRPVIWMHTWIRFSQELQGKKTEIKGGYA